MLLKERGIVLTNIRHSDRHNITIIYTRGHGRISVATSAGKGRAAQAQRTRLMPLSVVDIELSSRGADGLWMLRQVSPAVVWREIYFNPVKSAIGICIAEFLGKLVRELPSEEALWDFVADSLMLLDETPGGSALANFPLVFFSSVAAFQGIAPDIAGYSPGKIFNMREGKFSSADPGHDDAVRGEEAAGVVLLSRMNYRNSGRIRLSRGDRRRLLDGMMRYFAIHLPGLGKLKSPDILAEVIG